MFGYGVDGWNGAERRRQHDGAYSGPERRRRRSPNGSARATIVLLQWFIGVCVTIVVLLLGLNYASMDKRVARLEAEGSPAIQRSVAAMQKDIEYLARHQAEVVRKLEANAAKLDALLERRGAR